MRLPRGRQLAKLLSIMILLFMLVGWLVFGEPGFFGHLNTIGFAFCHQIPARTPQFAGFSCPLCYRCSGLFFGILSGFLILFRMRFSLLRLADWRVLCWIGFSFAFYALDGLKTYGGFPWFARWLPDLPVIRYSSGICFGSALALFLAPAVRASCGWFDSGRPIRGQDAVSFIISAVCGWIILASQSGFVFPVQMMFILVLAIAPVFVVILSFFAAISAADRIFFGGLSKLPVLDRLTYALVGAAVFTAMMILIRYQISGGWAREFIR